MKISYKLTRRTTKTEKFAEYLKMCIITNFETIGYKLTAIFNISYSFLNYKLMRPFPQITAT